MLALALVTVVLGASGGPFFLPDQLAGWPAAASARWTAVEPMGPPVTTHEDILREYGCLGAAERPYASGTVDVRVTAWAFRDGFGAYGWFAHPLRQEAQQASGNLRLALRHQGQRIVAGTLVIEIQGTVVPADWCAPESAAFQAVLGTFEARVLPVPPLVRVFEQVGAAPGSIKLFRGPLALESFRLFREHATDMCAGSLGFGMANLERGDARCTVLVGLYESTPAASTAAIAAQRVQPNVRCYVTRTILIVVGESESETLRQRALRQLVAALQRELPSP